MISGVYYDEEELGRLAISYAWFPRGARMGKIHSGFATVYDYFLDDENETQCSLDLTAVQHSIVLTVCSADNQNSSNDQYYEGMWFTRASASDT